MTTSLRDLSVDEFYELRDTIEVARTTRTDDTDTIDRLDVRFPRIDQYRYGVEVNGVTIGQVLRPSYPGDGWTAYVSSRTELTASRVAVEPTRRSAVDEMLVRIAIYGFDHCARTPVR